MTIHLPELDCGGSIVIYTGDNGIQATERVWVKAQVLEFYDNANLAKTYATGQRIEAMRDRASG